MEKKITHTENMARKERLEAKKKVREGNKRGALTHLKRAKRYEKNASNYTQQLLNLETQTETLINQVNNIETFKALRETKMAMDSVKRDMNLDQVSDLRDDIEDHMADMDEINQLLGEQIGGDAYDEDDLEEEYERMMQDQAQDQVGEMPLPPTDLRTASEEGKKFYNDALSDSLPVAPSGDLEEEEAFGELEAVMAS